MSNRLITLSESIINEAKDIKIPKGNKDKFVKALTEIGNYIAKKLRVKLNDDKGKTTVKVIESNPIGNLIINRLEIDVVSGSDNLSIWISGGRKYTDIDGLISALEDIT